jgi:hypothetical protein
MDAGSTIALSPKKPLLIFVIAPFYTLGRTKIAQIIEKS